MSDQRFNTGNPIGSDSPLDRSDNTRNLDVRMNSDEPVGFDRFGNPQLNWAGIVAAGAGDTSIAVNAAARAEDAAARADDAASIAQAAGGIYPGTGLGLLNTPDGDYFWVVGSGSSALTLYRNVGGVAVSTGRSIRDISALISRVLLSDDFNYVTLIDSGSLNDQNWKDGSYIVTSGVTGNPIAGTALLEVMRAGSWSKHTVTSVSGTPTSKYRIIRFDQSTFGEWSDFGGGTAIADGSVTRAKLASAFDYGGLIDNGSLNRDWATGSYIVGSSMTDRPNGFPNGNAALEVQNAGNWRVETLTHILLPENRVYRVTRPGNSEYPEWLPMGGGGTAIADGSVTRAKLASAFDYVELVNSGSMDRSFKSGTYLIGSSVAARPAGMPGGNFHLRSESAGAWEVHHATHILQPEYRFMRVVRPNQSSYPAWYPTGEAAGGSTNRLLRKNVVFLGDSVTNSYSVPEKAALLLGANVINCGIGGTRMGVHTQAGYDGLNGWNIAQAINSGDFSGIIASAATVGTQVAIDQAAKLAAVDWSTVDYIVVGYGTNDFGGDRIVGTSEDTEETTFYGATKIVIDQIQAAYPRIRLLFWTPIWRRRTPTDTGGIAGGSDVSPNTQGLFLYQFGEAMQAVCKSRHIECLDLYYTSGISEATYSVYLADELHPSPLGADLLAAKLSAALTSKW